MIDVKLESLLAVSEYKNFTRAAEALSLTQPAISHHISQLEAECHAKLFIRGKDFKLTPEGEIAVKFARRMIALKDKMLAKIEDEKNHISRFRIGITQTSENNNITEVLAKYASENNDINITIITDTINNLYEMLENYELDLAIVEGKRRSNKLNYLMLDTDCLVCVVNNNNPLAKKASVTLNQLKKENMILRLPTSATRQLFEATLTSVNESINNFNVILEVDSVSTIKDLIRKDMGVSILAKSACIGAAKRNKLTILPIENLSMMRDMNIAYNKDFDHEELLNDIVKMYEQSLNSGN